MRWAKHIEPCLTRDKPATKINQAVLILDVETYPDASQHERAQRTRGICDALKRAGFSYKKTFYHPKIDVQARKCQQQPKTDPQQQSKSDPLLFGFIH